MPPNRAAWLTAKSVRPLEVKTAPYTSPATNEIVIKNGAIAINPVEWSKQLVGDLMFTWIKYPFVLGNDLAGEVVEVGSGVTRFKPGDRILGHALSMDPNVNKNSEGSFQEYTVVRANMASPIPDTLSYEEACVLPLGLSTAACALFQTDTLALNYPDASVTALGNSKKTENEVLVIWGGSSSVGCNAIQLATAAGYDVLTTASPKNFEFVISLGATQVFDYRSKTVITDILKALEGKKSVGAIAIGNGSTEACMEILSKTSGSKFIAQISFPWPEKIPTTTLALFGAMMGLLWWNLSIFITSRLKGVTAKFVFGSSLYNNEVGGIIYDDFLPVALAQGSYVAAPKPLVVGKGLEKIQEAMDFHMKGVSAKKVVVSL
ncbi:Zinc-binding oxidoreductase CipB [Penicillium digitatum]|uniref:Zinc-binding oxidoreductase CipB n=3 Tax=Penicillium digitatum TaxID=36651 RepID=K9FBW6_PEND2|nr:Zinc-binding oxidoreductase CipB [Penicillium digitatum Pd1]EKV06850.1 Zinc-binding oxidoreductase CipB [Penicillium digitatum PHI26]EKV13886.1 Zinc-binding oxidoreductase CipB [Penicillium digitatum Pd1]QQK46324.1 Zinc-binding oxidoreductase CipB [Penicillium digitatum]